MQKTLFIKLSIIASLCVLFVIGLTMFRDVITERQYYADSVIREIADQHVNPQEVITPFIAIPSTTTPECLPVTTDKTSQCEPSYTSIKTVFATQTSAAQDLNVSTDTYQRGIYHATSYQGNLTFEQSYTLDTNSSTSNANPQISTNMNQANAATVNQNLTAKKTVTLWEQAKLIIPVSDLRGVATLPTITIDKQTIKATYPNTPMLNQLSYVEVALPQNVLAQLQAGASSATLTSDVRISRAKLATTTDTSSTTTANFQKTVDITIELPLAGIGNLNTVPTGQNFELSMSSNWSSPNFIGKALPNAKSFTADGFDAKWQNQYLTVANNQYLSECLGTPNTQCTVLSQANLESNEYYDDYEASTARVQDAVSAVDGTDYNRKSNLDSVRLNRFGVSFAEPNDVYLQTERTMKYALLLILVSFGTFFLFEIIKSSRIHPIQYLLVGCALLTFYVLLLPLAEQIAFLQAYAIAASACVGLIGWYSYHVLDSIKRAVIFTTILAGLYAAFYGILTTEDLNLLLGAVFCFIILACVMIMTRKIDWYKIA